MKPVERAGLQTKHQERFGARIEGRPDPQGLRRPKPKTRIVGRVPENDDDVVPPLRGIRKTAADERRTDSAALTIRQHSERCERESRACNAAAFHSESGEEDVPHDVRSIDRYEAQARDERRSTPQRVDQARLVISPKRVAMDAVDRLPVALLFGPYRDQAPPSFLFRPLGLGGIIPHLPAAEFATPC